MDPIAAASRRWPDIKLSPEQFRAWLKGREPLEESLPPERFEALFLVCACLRDAPGAHRAFDEAYGRLLEAAAARVRGGAPIDEVVQQVRLRLLTSNGPRGAKLSEYSGRGDFTGWLRTVTLRVALSMRPARSSDDGGEAALARIVSTLPDAERGLLKAENAALLKGAFADALRELEPRQRTLLKMSVVDGLSIDQIAPFYSVHRATAARWLDAVRRDLQRLTTEALRRNVGPSAPHVESLLGSLGSHVNLSLDRLLKSDP